MQEKIYAVWLAEALGPGARQAKALIEKYGSFEKIYSLGEQEYAGCGVIHGSGAMQRLLSKDVTSAEKSCNFCNHYFFGIIEYTSNQYPKRLRAIADPPPVLFARGKMIDFDDNVCIAVVGTRSYSDAGWNATYKVSSDLARNGAIVVTGLASGIDTAAAKAALAASGFAVGILGTGIERIYPSENTPLFEQMYKSGLVMTELPPFSETSRRYFPVRNRIISGLCHGVLVGEGAVKSGAMITASHAAEQGRHLFAIPGDISGEESSGVNKLIREGATPVFGASDILGKYYYTYPHRITQNPESDTAVPSERSSKRVRMVDGAKKKNGNTKSGGLRGLFDRMKNADTGKSYANTAENTVQNIKPSTPPGATKAEKDGFPEFFGELEKKVYEVLSKDEYKTSDRIAGEVGITVMQLAVALTTLEMEGYATQLAGAYKKL